MTIRIISVALAILLSACSTPYQETGLLGGVSATQIDATTLRITGRGNGYTRGATIQNYVLLRAAEETLKRGYDMFLIVNESDTSRRGTVFIPGQSTSYTSGSVTASGNMAYGSATRQTYSTPGAAIGIVKPGADIVVKMFKGTKPTDAPPNLYVASEVAMYIGAQVRR